MKAIIFAIGFIVVAAMANNASLFSIGLIILLGFTMFSLSNRKASITNITQDNTSLFDKLDQINIKTSDKAIHNAIGDLGKISGAIMQGKKADVSGKALLKSTHQVLENSTSMFK